MAGLRFYSRRIRRLFSTKVVQLSSICLVLFLGVQCIILYNFESDVASSILPRPTTGLNDKRIDWSRLYYVQYVTTPHDLCSSLMIWHDIKEIGCRAQRLMLHPSNWNITEKHGEEYTPIARMLQQANNTYNVTLRPLDVLMQNKNLATVTNIWADPHTKLLGFNLTEFDRVLTIDSASVVKHNLDELFLLPSVPLAMPYVYWGQASGWHFSTQLMLMTPSTASFTRVSEALNGASAIEYDTSILETLFYGKIIKIPQRPFALLSGEYRRKSHEHYLAYRWPKTWDPDYMLKEARILHFSDHPLPKPWIKASQDLMNRNMPRCKKTEWFGASDCRDRAVWLNLYKKYADKRKTVCGSGFEVVSGTESASEDIGKVWNRLFHPK